MWENQVFFVFVFIAVVLFSLACLSVIILTLVSSIAIASIKNKMDDLLDKSKETVEIIQETAINVNEAGYGLLDLVGILFNRRRKNSGFFSFLRKILGRS